MLIQYLALIMKDHRYVYGRTKGAIHIYWHGGLRFWEGGGVMTFFLALRATLSKNRPTLVTDLYLYFSHER